MARWVAGHSDLKRFYDVCAEQPHHYDIVLNTDRLDPSAAADVIAGLATA